MQISESEPNHWEAYILEVKGHRGEVQVFSSSTKVYLELEDIATFIQTDKVMYSPGQTVKIRVVSIHSDGKPLIGPVDIIIRVKMRLLYQKHGRKRGQEGKIRDYF